MIIMNLKKLLMLLVVNILNVKVTVIRTNLCLLKNISIRLDHISHLRNSHLRSSHLRSSHSIVLTANNYEKKIFVHSIEMLNLSLNELKLIAESRGIKGYKSMSEDY